VFISKHAYAIGAVLKIFGATYLIVSYGLHLWDILKIDCSLQAYLINKQIRLLEYPLLAVSVASLIGGVLLIYYKVRAWAHVITTFEVWAK
jgi:hypothetical protein